MAWYRQLLNVLRPGRVQQDLEHELSFHVAERVEELRAEGMSEAEAVRAARQQFGNYTTHVETTRDMDIHGWLETGFRNLRYAARALSRTPAFSVTVVLTLALAMGANTAVFSAINAVLLRPLPFPDGDRLVRLEQSTPKIKQPFLAPIRLEEWNRMNGTLEAITGYYSQDDSELSGELPEKLRRALVAPRFLKVLGITPALGRDFTPEEETFGGPNAVLISDRLWRRRFGAEPRAIGKMLRFGQTSVPVIGVMPASFRFPAGDVDLWSVSPPQAPYAQSRESTWFVGIGRLKAGVTLAQARANLATVQANLGQQFPKTDAQISAVMRPLKEVTVGTVSQSLWLLFGAVTLLLLIACVNIAALLLSRAAGRGHEIAVRFSLGASRAAVAAQLFTEVSLLSMAGAALGLVVAAGASAVFRSLAKELPRIEEISLDGRIGMYSVASALIVTLICGLVPAIRSTRRNLAGSLGAGRSRVAGRNPVQFVLVGIQVALAVTLLTGAGLLARSFQALGRVDAGFDPQRVLIFHISSSWGETGDLKAFSARFRRIMDSLQTVAGVEAVAATLNLPGVPAANDLELSTTEGRAETEPKILAQSRVVTPGYFATVRIPLWAGTPCREDAGHATMMVNRNFAQTYFGGGAAVGHHLFQPGVAYGWAAEVSGIVGDAREAGMDRDPAPTVYWCGLAAQPGTFFLLRTHGDPRVMTETIRRKIHELEPRRSVYDLEPLTDQISDAYAENRLRTILLIFFAATAVSLACIGLYGTLSYLVSLRQREIGLRLALGAARSQIVGQFLGQGLRMALIGAGAGLALAAATTRLLTGMLFGISPLDAITLAGVTGIVLAVSAVASLAPAVRAARLEPMHVLREE